MADLLKYAEDFLCEMIDEAVLGTCFEVHRALRLGTLFLDEVDPSEEERYKLCEQVGFDIFGVPKSGSKKPIECECPNCKRTLAATRFAPHLEKCMGMGRNSSRIASQRIANSGKQSVTDGNDDEADYDADWIAGYEGASRRSTKKRKSDKVSSSPRVKGQLTKSKLQAGTARHTDQNENIHIDVVNGGLVLTPGAPESGSTPKIRIKSPFDPSLGTWEPATIEARPPDVSRKKSKHSGSKKKKRQNIAQNYSYT